MYFLPQMLPQMGPAAIMAKDAAEDADEDDPAKVNAQHGSHQHRDPAWAG